MVHEPQLKPLLEEPGHTLEQVGRTLIAAANENGGRDNITVILFRLEDVEDRRAGAEAGATAEYDTFSGEAAEPRQGVTRPSAHDAGDAAGAEHADQGTVAVQALHPGDPRSEGGAAAPAREPPERTAPLPGDGPIGPRTGGAAAAVPAACCCCSSRSSCR